MSALADNDACSNDSKSLLWQSLMVAITSLYAALIGNFHKTISVSERLIQYSDENYKRFQYFIHISTMNEV